MFRQRNNNRNQQRNANTKRRNRNLARTRNGITQRGNGVSHQDNVRQVRKFQVFDNLEFSNAGSDYAFGLTNINIQPSRSPLKELLKEYKSLYEQYRIRRIRIRAQVGKGYTNDRRLTTIIGARVDVDRQVQGATIANVQSINCAENAILRTFTERGNILIADYRPQNRMINTYLPPMLPNNLQFYPMEDFDDHRWKGATVTAMIPEPTLQVNSLGITLMTEIDVEFRGRVTTPTAFTGLTTINQHDARVLPSELIGETFTVPTLSRNYEIISGDDNLLTFEAKWGNNNIDIVTMANLQIRLNDGTYTNWTGPVITGY